MSRGRLPRLPTFGRHVQVVQVEDAMSVDDLLADDGEAVHVTFAGAIWRAVLQAK